MPPRTLLYCTETAAGIHACIRGRGQGSLGPPENRRNIVFPCNAGPDPLKNLKVANLAFNVGPSSVCQQIQWRFATVARCRHVNSVPYKKVKDGPLCQNIMPPQVLRLNTPSPKAS